MTVPAATKNPAVEDNSAIASGPLRAGAAPEDVASAGPSAADHDRQSARTPSAHSSAGNRRANSLTPNNCRAPALSQVDSGGLAQKGVPGVSCGVTQLPVSSITRAISP
jgi:hypothetical protein